MASPASNIPRRIILDVDPGIDDAMAILFARRSPELQVEAITVVCGNVPLRQGAVNALKLAELAGFTDVLVAAGERHPLIRRLITAEVVHGPNGLGGVELPPPSQALDRRHAVDLIAELVSTHPGEITLVPVGPLTNIARAIRREPSLVQKIPEIILMGGSIHGGNATPAAEANIYNDPTAARIVFESGIPITMVGLDATLQCVLDRQALKRLQSAAWPAARVLARMAEHYITFAESVGRPGAALHDPLAVGLAVDKSFATQIRPMHIDIETAGQFTLGQTVANRSLTRRRLLEDGDRYVLGEPEHVAPNAMVPLKIDAPRFVETFLERLTAVG